MGLIMAKFTLKQLSVMAGSLLTAISLSPWSAEGSENSCYAIAYDTSKATAKLIEECARAERRVCENTQQIMKQDRPTGPTWKCVGKSNEIKKPIAGEGPFGKCTSAAYAPKEDAWKYFAECSLAPKKTCEEVASYLKSEGVDTTKLMCMN